VLSKNGKMRFILQASSSPVFHF